MECPLKFHNGDGTKQYDKEAPFECSFHHFKIEHVLKIFQTMPMGISFFATSEADLTFEAIEGSNCSSQLKKTECFCWRKRNNDKKSIQNFRKNQIVCLLHTKIERKNPIEKRDNTQYQYKNIPYVKNMFHWLLNINIINQQRKDKYA